MNLLYIATTDGYTGFWGGLDLSVWSAALRMLEAIFNAAPFLVVGVIVAGVMRGLIGTRGIRRLFGVDHWSGPVRAWLIGILLPICSLGALPVARELRRAGIPSGTILSFVLVAPVLNPISILYGISQISWITLFYFAIGTMIVSLGIGFIWNHAVSSKHDSVPEEVEPVGARGGTRLKVTALTTTRGLIGPNLLDYGLAFLAVGLMGAFIPYGTLQFSMTRDNLLATGIMSGVAIPAYVTPFDVMVQYGMIVRDGYSLGAAFALIVLGAGANVGVANWIRRDYGKRYLGFFVALLMGVTLTLGITADRALSPGKATVDHTHAFDQYTRLNGIHTADGQSRLEWLAATVTRDVTPMETTGLVLFGTLVLLGIVLFSLRDRISVKKILSQEQSHPIPAGSSRWERPLSFPVLSLASGLTLAGCLVPMVFMFYPPAKTLLGETKPIRIELIDAIRDEDHDEINRRLTQWEGLLRKLPIATQIREGKYEAELRESVDDLLNGLGMIRNHNEHGQFQRAQAMVPYILQVNQDCIAKFEHHLGFENHR